MFGKFFLNKLKICRRKNGDNEEDKLAEYKRNIQFFNEFKMLWDKRAVIENRQEFCKWLGDVYVVHNKKYDDNKNSYFKEADELATNETQVGLLSSIYGVMVKCKDLGEFSILLICLCFCFVAAKGLYVDLDEVLCGSVLAGIIYTAVLITLIILLGMVVGNIANTEYQRKMSRVNQKRETWLRHQEGLAKYQYEMLKYIYNLNEYNCLSSQRDKDFCFMEKILKVWKENQEKFQENMKKRDEEGNDI